MPRCRSSRNTSSRVDVLIDLGTACHLCAAAVGRWSRETVRAGQRHAHQVGPEASTGSCRARANPIRCDQAVLVFAVTARRAYWREDTSWSPRPAAHATSLDYLPTADAWLAEHGHDIRRVYQAVPGDNSSIILANTLLDRSARMSRSWGHEVFVAVDQTVNAILGVASDESISARSFRLGSKAGARRCMGPVANYVGDR